MTAEQPGHFRPSVFRIAALDDQNVQPQRNFIGAALRRLILASSLADTSSDTDVHFFENDPSPPSC